MKMMLYKNTKAMVCSPDGDANFFDIVAGILLGDALAKYLFIICLDYVLKTLIDLLKENGFMVKTAQINYSASCKFTCPSKFLQL